MACPAPSSPPPPSHHFPSTHPLQIPTTRLNPKPDLIYFRRHRRRPPSPSPSTSMSNPKPSDPQQHSSDFIFSVKSPKSDVRTPSCNRPKAPVDRGEYIIALPAVIPSGRVSVDVQTSGKSNNALLQKRDSRGRFEKEESGVCSDKAIVDCSSGLGNGSAVKQSRVGNRLVENLPRRFTRSAGRKKKEEETRVEEKETRLVDWLTDGKGRFEKEVSNCRLGNGSAGKQSRLALGDGRSTRKGRFEKEVSNRRLGNGSAGKQSKLARGKGRSARKGVGNVGKEKATRSSLKAQAFADDRREVAGTSIVIFQEENLVEIPIIFDNWDRVDVGDGQLDESIRAVYEGLVTVNLATEFDKGNGVLLEDFTNTPRTKRRCTRSSVKGANEESVAADALALAVVNSVQLDDSEGDNGGLNGSLSMMLKKKMELKMSKKITLTKLPSTIKDLLGTGLLEGLLVTYNSCPGKKVGLQGLIRGTGILCSCTSCRGATVVSIYQFEVHAGSTNKYPSNFIFFQNGKNLREVLRSCIGVSLDMLEAVIQNAIGPLSTKKLSVCEKCKGTGTFSLLCNLCVERNHQQGIPTASNGPSSCPKLLPGRILVPFVSDGTPMNSSPLQKLTYGKLTRKDLGLHKLVFMDGILPQGTEVGYYLHGKRLLEGYIKDSGIFCRCCSNVLSPSQFEAHAGQASRRKPYNNIYTSNGVSLHELSVSLSKGRRLSSTENDDLCRICADGGDLLLCDLCPRAFHKECVGLSSIPIGDWFCPYCQNLHQKDKCFANDDNAIAAGRVTGVDPIEQIIKRCIRIVSAPENDAGVCALCRQHDFRRSGFDRRTVIICDQCEIEYHVGCLKDHGMADLKELPEGEWFCRPDCRSIHSTLHELLGQGPEVFQELDANIIRTKHGEIVLNKDASADIRWRLLSGRSDHADSKLLLSQAISIFRESFDPIIDPISGRDLMPFMVYGKNMRRQDYGGVYCMVLTLNSSVISAALLRVLGCEIAELPLVATKREMQGRGYFQALFTCIERLLKSLKVKHFVLPAADDTESMWINKFGFAKLMRTELLEHAKNAQPIIFQGASILHKLVGASVSG